MQSHLKTPYPTAGYQSADERFHLLDTYIEKEGALDCVFLGSSMVAVGLDPTIFSDAYRSRIGEYLDCFNFGVAVGTASSYAPLVSILINNYHPNLIILGIGSRDFDGRESYEPEAVFQNTPWARYHEGKLSISGWIAEYSYVYRYLSALPGLYVDQLGGDLEEETDPIRPKEIAARSLRPDYSPMLYFHDIAPIYVLRDRKPYLPSIPEKPFQLSSEDFKGYKGVIQHALRSRTALIIIEIPTPESFYVDWSMAPQPTEPQVFRDQIAAYARDMNVPFWETRDLNLVDFTDFSDVSHLYIRGAKNFSKWLGAQVGEATMWGLFEGSLSKEMISAPPIMDLSFNQDNLLYKGMSEPTYRDYMKSQSLYLLTPAGARVYNPRESGLSRGFIQTITGFFIEWGELVNDQNRIDYFDLFSLQERMMFRSDFQLSPNREEALDNWSATHMPGYLKTAGVDYLFFTERWNDETTTPDPTLGNPLYYALIKQWDFPPLHESYYLYKVIGDQT